MPHEPIHLTNEQQALFDRVHQIIQDQPQDFQEAGKWLDALAATNDDDPYKIIQDAAHGFWRKSPHYRNNPAENLRTARRVLLVAWILSDERSLKTEQPITHLQAWDWGDANNPYSFIGDWPDGEGGEFSRSLASMMLFDDNIDDWTVMVTAAIECLKRYGCTATDRQQNKSELIRLIRCLYALVNREPSQRARNEGGEFDETIDCIAKKAKLCGYAHPPIEQSEGSNGPEVTFYSPAGKPAGSAIPEPMLPSEREQWRKELTDILERWLRHLGDRDAVAPPAPPVGAAGQAGSGESVKKGTITSGTSPTLQEPPAQAFKAYRAHRILGQKQTDVADTLHVNQGQVSRWVKQVAEWIEAGNVLPDLPTMTTKPAALDPDIIEMGERQNGLTKRQRQKRSDDDADD